MLGVLDTNSNRAAGLKLPVPYIERALVNNGQIDIRLVLYIVLEEEQTAEYVTDTLSDVKFYVAQVFDNSVSISGSVNTKYTDTEYSGSGTSRFSSMTNYRNGIMDYLVDLTNSHKIYDTFAVNDTEYYIQRGHKILYSVDFTDFTFASEEFTEDSNKVIFIDKRFKFNKKNKTADAVITSQKKIPLAILTADCAPIFLYDKKKNMVAAIHAGWKGAYKDIIKKVIKFMLKKGCERKNMIAAIGPCIQEKSYNVKKDFLKKFIKKDKKNKVFFKSKKNMIYFNLTNFVKSQLKFNKITNIEAIKIDTFDKKNNFFSARRSLRLKHDDYGRNISIIMIN